MVKQLKEQNYIDAVIHFFETLRSVSESAVLTLVQQQSFLIGFVLGY